MPRPERRPVGVLTVLSLLVAALFLVGDATPLDVPAAVLPALVLLALGAAGVSAALRRLQAPPRDTAPDEPIWLPPTDPPYSPPRF